MPIPKSFIFSLAAAATLDALAVAFSLAAAATLDALAVASTVAYLTALPTALAPSKNIVAPFEIFSFA